MANRGTAKNRTKARKQRQRQEAYRVLLESFARDCGGHNVAKWSDERLRSFIKMKRPALRIAVDSVEALGEAGRANLFGINTPEAHFMRAMLGG